MELRPVVGSVIIEDGSLTGGGGLCLGTDWRLEYPGREVERPQSGPSWRVKGILYPRGFPMREKGLKTRTYADVAKLKPGRIGDRIWLELEEREMQGRRWPYHHWLLRGRLSIAVLGRGLLLLEFESLSEAEQVLAKGIRRIPCIWKDGTRRWGDGCGGFIAVEEDITFMAELEWARSLVKMVGRDLPSSAQIVVGLGCFSIQLWWEIPSWFVQLMPLRGSHEVGVSVVGEEDGGNPRAACIRSQKEKVVQTKVQVGVQDVSSYGGKSKKVAAFSVACSARGSDEGTEEGDGEGSLVCRGQEVGANMSSISRLGGHRHGLGGFRKTLAVFDRAAITDKALLGKASRYNDSPSIFVGGGDLSSSLPSSSYGWALAAGGSSGLGGSSWEMETKEEKTLAEEDSCLKFNKFLGFSTEGFEGEILNLLLRMKNRREQSKRRGISISTRFERELKKLETKIQDMSLGVVRSLGVRRFLEWGAVNARGVTVGVVVFWENRMLELVEMEEELEAICRLWNDPWCIGGDFNVIKFPRECSREGRVSSSMRRFSEVIDDLNLKYLPLVVQGTLPRPMSDHFPILLDGRGGGVVSAFQILLMEPGDWHPSLNGLDFDKTGVEEATRLEEVFIVEEVLGFFKEFHKWGRLIRGRSGDGAQITQLLFIDDMQVFCEASQEQMTYLSWLLMWFETISGLRINLDKSEILPMGRVENVEILALKLGCKVGSLPSTYLGLPLGALHK
ncbi:hypothetical protein CK203_040950 [Vitis vinifera]|uniref:DUF4283 domain-containing protein n=1 Tax=Vitis vinifera TaxID=29760 RepID=A0A438HV79_VITVI|nr:hypothetical protein CK203_040950 [Vitis vinifera]